MFSQSAATEPTSTTPTTPVPLAPPTALSANTTPATFGTTTSPALNVSKVHFTINPKVNATLSPPAELPIGTTPPTTPATAAPLTAQAAMSTRLAISHATLVSPSLGSTFPMPLVSQFPPVVSTTITT